MKLFQRVQREPGFVLCLLLNIPINNHGFIICEEPKSDLERFRQASTVLHHSPP